MKKIIFLIMLLLLTCSVFAENTYDLNFKFTPNEITNTNSNIIINGNFNMLGKEFPYNGSFEGIIKQTCIEATKDNTFKITTVSDLKNIESSNKNISNKIQPKTINYEIDSKGKIYNIFNEKGEIIQKTENSTAYFPIEPIKIGDNWESITNISGISLKTQSNLTNVKIEDNEAIATINSKIDTPIDFKELLKFIGLSNEAKAMIDEMEFTCHCKGEGETNFNLNKGKPVNVKTDTIITLEGSMFGQVIIQGEFTFLYTETAINTNENK